MKREFATWEELYREADLSVDRARKRLARARLAKGKRELDSLEKKIRQHIKRGVVFPPKMGSRAAKKKLEEGKYAAVGDIFQTIRTRVERTVDRHDAATTRLNETLRLKSRIAERTANFELKGFDRLKEKYDKGKYSELLGPLDAYNSTLREQLARLDSTRGVLDNCQGLLHEKKLSGKGTGLDAILSSAHEAYKNGRLEESENMCEEFLALMEKREKEAQIPWTTVESNIRYILPHYTITHKTGSGGSSIVYRGKDRDGRAVAIKLPRFLDETLDARTYERFEAESRIWKKLDHGSIVEVYDAGHDPLPYIVMELMEGGSLKEILSHRRLAVKESIYIILDILDAISYAHRMATIHRDIKPENILFTKDGIPKISDWGIGKFMASENITRTTGGAGTLSYSAPEQMSPKEFGKVDWSTDLFQLGIVFYEMLTGMNPFHAEDPATVMAQIIREDPEPPSFINSEISPSLDRIVMKALEKSKGDRWRSVDIMYHELKKL